MSEDADVPNRKKRDPILMVGTIVLALAFVVVISGYAYGEFIAEDKSAAKYGDKVKVDYVGSYYGYYLDDNGVANPDAVVFDTSKWSVADDDDITKSYEFTKRAESDYKPFNVTIGSGGALADFENILIGAKPGETVRVEIPNAYGTVSSSNEKTWDTKGMEFDRTQKMLIEEFRLTFGLTTVQPGPYTELKHPYGWDCTAVVSNNGFAFVTHHVEDKTYPSDAGGMEATVKFVDDITKLKFTVDLDFNLPENFTSTGEFKMVQFMYGGITYYVTGLSPDGVNFFTKNTVENRGMTMYFVITFIGYQ